MKTKILDSSIIEDIQDLMTMGETIVWEGVPNPEKSISSLEMENSSYDAQAGFGNTMGSILIFSLGGAFYFYMKGIIILVVLFILFGILALVIPEILKKKRKENTRYFITSKRIVFQLWSFGKKSTHQIPFSNLKNMIISEGENKKGVIYFIVKNPKSITFSTYSFEDGERRHQPTFETIENVNEVATLIREHISKKIHS